MREKEKKRLNKLREQQRKEFEKAKKEFEAKKKAMVGWQWWWWLDLSLFLWQPFSEKEAKGLQFCVAASRTHT